MEIVTYQNGDHALLKKLADNLGESHGLRYPEFVDYYYAGSQWCNLHVAVDNDELVAVLGVEQLNFVTADREIDIGFGSNFTSFRPGAGGVLLRHWLKNCDLGMMSGGSEDTHEMFRRLKWTFYPNIREFYFNKVYRSYPDNSWWKKLAKAMLRIIGPKANAAERAQRVLRDGAMPVEVTEKRYFAEDMLPKHMPFSFRFCPGVDYLNWRYNTELSFVRYRLFQIINGGESAGYVVVNELPDRVLVAQYDGEDPLVLCGGIFATLAEVCRSARRREEVFLTSSHSIMQESFRRFGFRESNEHRPFAIGGLGRRDNSIPPDTSQWLVNFDWGDNGLRAPFLGQPSI